MKKWKCTVCGHLHEGDSPPEECPLCKAAEDKFEQVHDEGGKRWRCTVCGYIHEGEEPPETCPVCQAERNKFVQIDAEGNEISEAEQSEATAPPAEKVEKPAPGLLVRLILKLHLHPIAVHTPNGLIPVAVLFLLAAIFLNLSSFEKATYYNLVFVLLTMPVVLATGYLEWKNRYQGAKTFLFISKLFSAGVATLALVILVLWRFAAPAVLEPDSPYRLIYLGIAIIMLLATAIAGHLGGKLVFGSRGD